MFRARVMPVAWGIPEHELDQLFDVAFRGSAARTPAPKGDEPVGGELGLAIAKGLVEGPRGGSARETTGPAAAGSKWPATGNRLTICCHAG